MPYKDKQKQKDADRKYRQKVRQAPENVEPIMSNPIDPDWQHVKDYILSECPGMPRVWGNTLMMCGLVV